MFGAALLVLLCVSFVLAAPTSSVAPSDSQSMSSQSLPTHTHRHSLSHSLTIHTPLPFSVSSHSSPTESPRPVHNKKGDSERERSQQIATIVLGAIAGSIALGFLIAILRCMFNYKRPPKRDRIAEILQRHNLHCEMAELERNPYALRRPSLREPAPPYFPSPPSYAESVRESVYPSSPTATEHSRTNSTSSSTRNLLPISPQSPGFPTIPN